MGFFQEIINGLSPAALAANKFGGGATDSVGNANQYLNQIPGLAEKNLSPYIKPGQQSQDFVNQIMQGYKPSEGYNFQQGELNKNLTAAANSGGYAGGEYDQGQRGKLMQGLLSQDMQQWLDNVLGVHNKSFDASRELNDIQGGALNQQGSMAFGQGENQNQQRQNLMNQLLKLAAGAAGGAIGGPVGAGIGSAAGGAIGGGGQMNTGASGSQYGNPGLFNRTPRASQSTYPGSQFGV